jgi:hypothetical protein
VKGKAINMNYVNYDIAIVQKHRVELVGWPDGIPFANPSAIGTVGAVRILREALIVGDCKWIAQTKRQQGVHAAMLKTKRDAGDPIGKKRKQRSDKGKKRSRQGVEDISDGEPQKKKKRAAMSKSATSQLPPAYKSRNFINDESDDDEEEC